MYGMERWINLHYLIAAMFRYLQCAKHSVSMLPLIFVTSLGENIITSTLQVRKRRKVT